MPELVLYGIRSLAKQLLGTVLDIEVDQSEPGHLLPQTDGGRPEESHDGRGVCGPGGGDPGQDPDGQHDGCWCGGGGQDLGLQLPEVPEISEQLRLQQISVSALSGGLPGQGRQEGEDQPLGEPGREAEEDHKNTNYFISLFP